MSLRTKIFLPLFVMMALLIGYLYLSWLPQSLARVERQYREATERHLDSVVEWVIPLLLGRQLDTIHENFDALLKKNRDWISIRLTDSEDKALYPLGTSPPAASASQTQDVLTLHTRISYLDVNLGTLTVAVDFTTPLTEWKREFRKASAVVLIVIAVVVLCIGIILERKIVQPVRTLERAAQDLSQGRFDTLHLKAEDDEIGHLVGSFNAMRENLATSYSLLRESEQKTRAIATTAHDAIIMIDERGSVSFWNPAAENIFGYSSDEMLGRQLHSVIVPDRYIPDYEKGFSSFSQTGQGQVVGNTMELIARKRDGAEFPVELSMSALRMDNGWHAIGIVRDITQRKLAENNILASLEEKELLLHEVHHRVKNNLQVIISLLDLQLGHIGSKSPAEIFSEIKNRIKSMSLVHEKLYLAKDVSRVNLMDYVESLASNLYKFYNIGLDKVALSVEMDDISLSIDTAVPFGLIVNELVTNCLKYAFPDGRTGKVSVALRKTGRADDGRDLFELTVSDSGIGIPADLDLKDVRTLGLYLVTTLVEHQLRGTISLHRDKGTEFVIKFREMKYKKRI